VILKSYGQTPSENRLSLLCDKTFLQLWSYANPFKDDSKEFCDLIAVFEDHVFIFFDREKVITEDDPEKLEVSWGRWFRSVVQDQTRTCHGAEKYLKSGRKLYLDASMQIPFPVTFDRKNMIVHKIVVAHGALEACKGASAENLNGSLAISYCDTDSRQVASEVPFSLLIDRKNPVHILDSHNLPILLAELDTFFDFTNFIVAKEAAIEKYDVLSYCGEEDLLAHYLGNYDEDNNRHYIGTRNEQFNFVMIGEGEWNAFLETKAYKSKHDADKISYLWDDLIQKTCENALNDTLGGDSDLFSGRSAIFEMAKEPRFSRRALAENMEQSIRNFPSTDAPIVRNLSYMPSFYPNKAYIFLQLKVDIPKLNYDDYREKRRYMLELACGVARNRFKYLEEIVGIAVEPPKLYRDLSEDFILLNCRDWTDEQKKYYQQEDHRTGLNFFETENLVMTEKRAREFPDESLGRS